ncbi:MAG TPA: TadE family protein [Terriglobales bacterium]|nr:TadE family protein [Terriglobales bacterium]
MRWRPESSRAQRGQALLESALVVMLFFLLTFGLLDFGRMFYVQMTLQNAVREAGRYASTGNHLPDPNHPNQNLSRVNSIIQIATQAALGTTVTGIQITSQQGGKGDPGGPGDTVTVSLTTNLKLITPLIAHFFPGGQYTFTSSTTFKNEPFPPTQTY